MGYQVNLCMPYYEPGQRITMQASADVLGKRFVRVTGNRQNGPGVSDSILGGNYVAANVSTSGDPAAGVAEYNAVTGKKFGVITTGAVVPVTAGAAITAGQEVQSDNVGRAIPLAAGRPLGYAMSGQATVGSDVDIKLY